MHNIEDHEQLFKLHPFTATPQNVQRFELAEKNQITRIADLEAEVEAKSASDAASVDASVGKAFGEVSLELERERESKVQLAKRLEIEASFRRSLTSIRRVANDRRLELPRGLNSYSYPGS